MEFQPSSTGSFNRTLWNWNEKFCFWVDTRMSFNRTLSELFFYSLEERKSLVNSSPNFSGWNIFSENRRILKKYTYICGDSKGIEFYLANSTTNDGQRGKTNKDSCRSDEVGCLWRFGRNMKIVRLPGGSSVCWALWHFCIHTSPSTGKPEVLYPIPDIPDPELFFIIFHTILNHLLFYEKSKFTCYAYWER